MSLLEINTLSKVVDIYHKIISKEDTPITDSLPDDLQIIKDATGGYKWLAVYSNSFRDEDGVPEIIGSSSQKAFVDSVDAGHYDYPELQLWHNPKWKFGKATVVAYDEVEPGIVFAIAGGTIDVDKGYVAEALLASDVPFKLSHGMPTSGIKRELVDSTVYQKHITTEITVLPAQYAANPLTGFGLLGDDNMISNKKKAEIMGSLGVDPNVLQRLEDSNKSVAQFEKGTREYKETTMDEQTEAVEVQTEAPPVVAAEVVTEQVTEVPAQVQNTPANSEFDIQGILDANKAVSNDIGEIKASLDIVVEALGVLSVAQKNTLERVEAVEKAKENEAIAQTPTYSATFKERINSIIGQPAAIVQQQKGSDAQVLSGPKEEEPNTKANAFGSSFLGGLVSKGS